MLLQNEKTGRKVLNSEQIEAYIYNVTRNLSNYKLIDMDIKFLDYNYRTMFYVVQTEDNQYIILGDNTDTYSLKYTFQKNLPDGCKNCFYSKAALTALLMPDLVLTEKRIEESSLDE